VYSYFVSPGNIYELKETIDLARNKKLSVCPRGGGFSYGDETLNENNIVVDCTRMNEILSWDSKKGIMEVQPGVTVQQVLKVSLRDNWRLSAVPGTRLPTIGGCVANNVHGKNCYREGNFGECVLEFDILVASNEKLTCSRDKNSDLFFAAIGGLGILGIFTRIKLQLRKIPSTNLSIRKWTVSDLNTLLADILAAFSTCDYVVGQIDCFKKGKYLGRGTIHTANNTKNRSNSTYLDDLELPKRVFALVPDSWVLTLGRTSMSAFTMRCISSLKYYSDSFTGGKKEYIESFPKFHFLLDRIPYWPGLYKLGFFEFEPLIPKKNAVKAFKEIIALSHRYKLPPYIAGIKYHKEDEFLLSFALDGFSIGFDFPILKNRPGELKEMFEKMHEVVFQNGGIVYLAKDNSMLPEHFKKMYKTKIIEFVRIKKKYDPDMLFQSNLFRRLFVGFAD